MYIYNTWFAVLFWNGEMLFINSTIANGAGAQIRRLDGWYTEGLFQQSFQGKWFGGDTVVAPHSVICWLFRVLLSSLSCFFLKCFVAQGVFHPPVPTELFGFPWLRC